MGKKKNVKKVPWKKKGTTGSSVSYISRGKALKKLQISLSTFRKLCILKGIYPRSPPKSVKDKNRTYYHEKDIKYLLHDPLIERIRQYKVYKRKLTRIKAKKMYSNIDNLKYFEKPEWNIDHVIKERFPSFDMAVKELDEALSMTHLFASLPSNSKIFSEIIDQCKKISYEFQLFVIKKKALRKVFVSIKGIYYQVVVEGREVIWLAPWPYTTETERDDVDYRVMYSFLQLHLTLLGFVNFRLYKKLGFNYPPKWDDEKRKQGEGLTALVTSKYLEENKTEETTKKKKFLQPTQSQLNSEKMLNTLGQKLSEIVKKDTVEEIKVSDKLIDEDDDISEGDIDNDQDTFTKIDLQESVKNKNNETDVKIENNEEKTLPLNDRINRKIAEVQKKKPLFTNLKFFLGREILKDALVFVILSCGGEVSWTGENAPFPENDPAINYFIMDRPQQEHTYFGREYIQPQWVFDSVNENFLLPVMDYAPGKKLPDHLSPFVNDEHEGYTPKRREEILRLKAVQLGISLPDQNEEENDDDLDDSEAIEQEYLKGIEAEASGKSFSEHQKENANKKKEKRKKEPKKTNKEGDEEDPQDHDLAGLLNNKRRRLFQKIEKGKVRKEKKVERLQTKRKLAEKIPKKNN
eukprot:TRINITY_DN887_c1_g1_i1.p1 TRINITY_DN887_c1_g1~~TRINITY_DN887_c1_g1_i1.p1  ORF type:complete len:634 (-),score=237.76 TRINITY_DN887_c1_g1_i1:56-1957(-)